MIFTFVSILYRTAVAVRSPERHLIRDARMGILYRTAVAVRSPEGHLIRDARMGIPYETQSVCLCEAPQMRADWMGSGTEMQNKTHYLFVIRDYLEAEGLTYAPVMQEEMQRRKNGKKYSMQDHVRGMIYALLSNQTKWHRIEPHLPEIDALFFYYEPERILCKPHRYFSQGLFDLKCGNRNTEAQMETLAENIRTLERIAAEYGSMDAFITAEPAALIVPKLAGEQSPYKLKWMGDALVWEYLRNMGIDGAKPDTHLRRFFGCDRMGGGAHSPATIREVLDQVDVLSEETGLSKTEIDNLIWSFSADGYGKVCTKTPHCQKCPVKGYCKIGYGIYSHE